MKLADRIIEGMVGPLVVVLTFLSLLAGMLMVSAFIGASLKIGPWFIFALPAAYVVCLLILVLKQ